MAGTKGSESAALRVHRIGRKSITPAWRILSSKAASSRLIPVTPPQRRASKWAIQWRGLSASFSRYGVFQPGGLQQLAQESRKIGARRRVRPQQSSSPAAVSPVGRAFGRNHQPFLLPVCGRDGARHSDHE